MLIFCLINLFLLLQRNVNCEEGATEIADTFETERNVTVSPLVISTTVATTVNLTKSINFSSISQSSQTQQIERKIQPSSEKRNQTSSPILFSDFKPSQHLETYYEFNKFPVPPALPEAKHFHYYNADEVSIPKSPWTEKRTTTESSWKTPIKFPEIDATISARPYNFVHQPTPVSTEYLPTERFRPTPGNIDGFPFNKPVTIEKPKTKWHSKTEYNLMEKPGGVQKTYENGLGETGYSGNPWKKIFKFLTAFIPIGLLISALTPTVITVTNVNDTQTRYRSVDNSQEITKKLMESFQYFNKLNENGCEDRILCELLLSAYKSPNAEQHVSNLLNNLSEQDKNIKNKADDLKKVFDAVRKQDCEPIVCKSINKNN